MILVETKEFKKTIEDGATGALVTIHFRRPTANEQLAYDRKVSKGRIKAAGLRVRKIAGEMIKPLINRMSCPDPELAPFWSKDGSPVMLSSTPGDPGFREDWLAVLDAFSPNMLRLVGIKVFAGENFDEEDDDDEALEASPN